MLTRFALALLGATLPATLAAQGSNPPPKCDTAEHRQFDFWVGSWDVTVGGQPAGRNDITVEEDGCILHERWKGSTGSTGQSFNFYSRVTKKWRQVWIDNGGNPLDLTGEYGSGKMALAGTTQTPRGLAHQRLTFFKNDDGTVRQLWESSSDDGKTWSVAFDGLYRRR
ncbi:MAG: hypothetical protein ACKVZ0_00840 [Gemmatimonadales bacterium]